MHAKTGLERFLLSPHRHKYISSLPGSYHELNIIVVGKCGLMIENHGILLTIGKHR